MPLHIPAVSPLSPSMHPVAVSPSSFPPSFTAMDRFSFARTYIVRSPCTRESRRPERGRKRGRAGGSAIVSLITQRNERTNQRHRGCSTAGASHIGLRTSRNVIRFGNGHTMYRAPLFRSKTHGTSTMVTEERTRHALRTAKARSIPSSRFSPSPL